MKKSVLILGSTGSIGLHSLNIISKKKNLFAIKIFLLAANKNYYEIKRQIIRYKPKNFLIYDFKIYKKIKKENKNKKIKIINTIKDFKPKKKIDITITAIPGIAGLAPTLTTIKLSKKILIANKESIICGWDLIDRNAKI